MARTLYFGCECKKKSRSINQQCIKLRSYKKDVLNATAEVRNSCRSTCFSSHAFLCRVSSPKRIFMLSQFQAWHWNNNHNNDTDCLFHFFHPDMFFESQENFYAFSIFKPDIEIIIMIWDHSFKTSACLRGGGVSSCANGPKFTVHKDKKSPSKAFWLNADGRGVGVRNSENLPTS